MTAISNMVDRLRGIDLERALGLRAASPPVAVELEGHHAVLVRVKRRRGRKPLLEARAVRRVDEVLVPSAIGENGASSEEGLATRLGELFQASGTRPGRVALVLPDNLAKISLVALPEWPSSRRQLEEIIRFKMRRAVPFRLDEASMSYQVLPAEDKGISVFVALLRRGLVARYEQALQAIGARPGLVDLCTPNLLNLCREKIEASASRGGDVALLNCAPSYFTLVIVRRSRLIFFRCKSYVSGDPASGIANGVLAREMAGSFSYYQEKLAGQGIGTLLVRSVARPFEEIRERVAAVGVERIEAVDPAASVDLPDGLDEADGQRIAPAIGAAVGRGR